MRAALFGAIAATLLPFPSAAQDYPAEVRGIQVVVPDARGKSAWGTAEIARGVRDELASGVGELVSPKALADAQKKLKLRGDARYTAASLARAGKAAGAQFVLDVEITKKGWIYTAHAVLINTETGEQQMDFRSGFYKPPSEARDRGRRIAKAAIGKLVLLIDQGKLAKPGAVAAAPREPAEDLLDARVDDEPPPETPPATPPPASPPAPPPAPAREEPPEPPPPEPEAPPAEAPAVAMAPPKAERSAAPPPPASDRDQQDILRMTVTAGSGLVHTYDLSSALVSSSRLSYRLSPVALFSAQVEAVYPGIGVGAFAGVDFSPMKLDVVVDQAQVAAPRANLLDLDFGADVHLPFSGTGRDAYEVIPIVGIRIARLTVDPHPGSVALSSTSLTPYAGIALHMPVVEILDLGLAFDGGYVASYSESPMESGQRSKGGFQLGGGLVAKLWLSDIVGIALDTRFDFLRVSLEGTPTRPLPPDEDLSDATVTTKDLRLSLGVALRI